MASAASFAIIGARMSSPDICSCSSANVGNKRHSTYRSQFVTIEYPWHPLHGKRVPLLRRVGRGTEEFVHVEARRGVSRELPAWMCDASACAAISKGTPRVTIEALNELRDVLSGREVDPPRAPTSNSLKKEATLPNDEPKKTRAETARTLQRSSRKRSAVDGRARGTHRDFDGSSARGTRPGSKRERGKR